MPTKIILLIDTTYFWRKYWYMLFRARFPDEKKWKNLLWYKVDYETNKVYKEWIQFLLDQWWEIIAIVCDWRQWLLNWFKWIVTQMCIYHMKAILTRYITKNPILDQNISLKKIWECLWVYPKEDIELALKVWYEENKLWLLERNESWKLIHTRTKKAYSSLKNNLEYCYIFQEHNNLWIPNTTNSIESTFSHLKTKLRIHRWLSEDMKELFISYYLWLS